MSEEKEFEYQFEVGNTRHIFYANCDEKVGDVILRLESELCHDEVNFLLKNNMSCSFVCLLTLFKKNYLVKN